jgi:hypothetical protein
VEYSHESDENENNDEYDIPDYGRGMNGCQRGVFALASSLRNRLTDVFLLCVRSPV